LGDENGSWSLGQISGQRAEQEAPAWMEESLVSGPSIIKADLASAVSEMPKASKPVANI